MTGKNSEGWQDYYMAKVTVRIPEPKEQYEVDNQRQISRALRSIVEQLNSTFLTQEKEEQERFTFFSQ